MGTDNMLGLGKSFLFGLSLGLVVLLGCIAGPSTSAMGEGCRIGLQRALHERNPERVMQEFTRSLSQEYFYEDGSLAGTEVFKLSADDIRSAFAQMERSSEAARALYGDAYSKGIKLLTDEKIRKSPLYDEAIARLILSFDGNFSRLLGDSPVKIGSFPREQALLRRNNEASSYVRLISIEISKTDPKNYTVSNGFRQEEVALNDVHKIASMVGRLVMEIKKLSVHNNGRLIDLYIDMYDLSAKEFDVQQWNLQTQLESALPSDAARIIMRRRSGRAGSWTTADEVFFSRNGVVMQQDNPIEEVKSGPHLGWYRASFSIKAMVNEIIQETRLVVYGITPAILRSCVDTIKRYCGASASTGKAGLSSGELSVADIIARAYRDMVPKAYRIDQRVIAALKRDGLAAVATSHLDNPLLIDRIFTSYGDFKRAIFSVYAHLTIEQLRLIKNRSSIHTHEMIQYQLIDRELGDMFFGSLPQKRWRYSFHGKFQLDPRSSNWSMTIAAIIGAQRDV
jgi:hypothetical protein